MFTFGTVLSLVSLLHMWLMGNKWRWAPLFGLVLQAMWIYYVLEIIKDYGFLIGVAGFAVVNIRNHFKWNIKHEPTNEH